MKKAILIKRDVGIFLLNVLYSVNGKQQNANLQKGTKCLVPVGS